MSEPKNLVYLSAEDFEKLAGVHEDLVKVVKAAAEDPDGVEFKVAEGVRSLKRQRALFAHGASGTMKSRHLTGHAVDLWCLVAGEVRWDWPLYHHLAAVMKKAAGKVGVPIEWGGDWRSLKDGPHFQLPWDKYPLPK